MLTALLKDSVISSSYSTVQSKIYMIVNEIHGVCVIDDQYKKMQIKDIPTYIFANSTVLYNNKIILNQNARRRRPGKTGRTREKEKVD